MASAHQGKGKEGQPELLVSPFQWGAALSAVKDQVPSIDSDASVSDGETDDGDLFIFQRDQPNLIPDLSEELEELPLEAEDLEKIYTFMIQPREAWNEDQEDPEFQKDRNALQFLSIGNAFVNSDGLGILVEESFDQEAILTSQSSENDNKSMEMASGGFALKDMSQEKDLRCSVFNVPSGEASPFLKLNASEEERRVLIETKILSKLSLGPSSGDGSHSLPENSNLESMTKTEKEEKTVPTECSEKFMLSGFKLPNSVTSSPGLYGQTLTQELEKWNLDKLLQDLKNATPDTKWDTEPTFPSVDHETRRISSQSTLMGKLEELCIKQSKPIFFHHRRCRAKRPHFDQGDGSHVPVLTSLINGRSLSPEEFQYAPEPPTIYIDLRDAAPQSPESLAFENESLSDSSTDDEEDAEVTVQEEMGEKMKAFPQPSCKDYTAKSFLLQQLRLFRKSTSQSSAATADGGRRQTLEASEETDWLTLKRSQDLKWKGKTREMQLENSESESRSFPCFDLRSVDKPSKKPEEETETDPFPALPQDSFSSHNDLVREERL